MAAAACRCARPVRGLRRPGRQLVRSSLLVRLVKAAPWLGDIVAALIAEQAKVPAGRWAGYRLRALDGTSICQPGADRTTWRLHVGYDLATGQVDQLELTDVHGAENLQRLTYAPGDIVLGDRCYARPRDLRPVIDAGADFIVRTGWNSLRLLQPDGEPFDLFAALAAQVEQEGEVQVRVHEGTTGVPPPEPLILRLVIRRKDPGTSAKPSRSVCSRMPRSAASSPTRAVSRRRSTSFSSPRCRPPRSRRPTCSPALSLSLANRTRLQADEEPRRARRIASQEARTRTEEFTREIHCRPCSLSRSPRSAPSGPGKIDPVALAAQNGPQQRLRHSGTVAMADRSVLVRVRHPPL